VAAATASGVSDAAASDTTVGTPSRLRSLTAANGELLNRRVQQEADVVVGCWWSTASPSEEWLSAGESGQGAGRKIGNDASMENKPPTRK
jgi:hypothetical protein